MTDERLGMFDGFKPVGKISDSKETLQEFVADLQAKYPDIQYKITPQQEELVKRFQELKETSGGGITYPSLGIQQRKITVDMPNISEELAEIIFGSKVIDPEPEMVHIYMRPGIETVRSCFIGGPNDGKLIVVPRGQFTIEYNVPEPADIDFNVPRGDEKLQPVFDKIRVSRHTYHATSLCLGSTAEEFIVFVHESIRELGEGLAERAIKILTWHERHKSKEEELEDWDW